MQELINLFFFSVFHPLNNLPICTLKCMFFLLLFSLFTSLSISHSNNLTRNNINRTLTINGFIVLSLKKKSLSFYNCFVCKEVPHQQCVSILCVYFLFLSSHIILQFFKLKIFIHSTYDCFFKKNMIVDYHHMVVWKNVCIHAHRRHCMYIFENVSSIRCCCFFR